MTEGRYIGAVPPDASLALIAARLADHELWMVFLRDPDEHLLALMAERPLPAERAG